MSKTFCNDTDMVGIGFCSCNKVDTSELIDQTSNIDYHVCNKMGSSIPTIFARMFLFSSAYTDINLLEEKKDVHGNQINLGNAHNYVADPKTQEQYKNVYHHLISEHLDMLEFLFTYGSEITVERWRFSDEKVLLETGINEYEGVGRLVQAIESEILETPSLNGDFGMQVLLFKYKNELVGGTSPEFIVFTNPNWKEAILEHNWSSSFSPLFMDDNPRPLHERTLPFRQLLTLLAYGGKLNQVPALEKYIKDNEQQYDNEVQKWWHNILSNHQGDAVANWINKEIKNIADPLTWKYNGIENDVVSPVQNIPVYRQSPLQNFATDYKIAPTTTGWNSETINGKSVELQGEPMLIVENGIPGRKYFNQSIWSNTINIPDYAHLKNKYLSQREVPGNNATKYPIITADDLLEENIVELAYIIDNKHFFTGCEENTSFMLPVKHTYFRFFTFDDLKNNTKVEFVRDADNEVVSVNVSLIIPMQKGAPYILKRSYSYDKDARFRIIECRKGNTAFNMGIFPFFKLNNNLSNDYRFMLGETATKVKCRVGSFDKIGFVIPKDGEDGTLLEFTSRTERDALTTSFATYKETFDYIDVTVNTGTQTASGMFFPLMNEINNNGRKDYKWYYSVDFGTSNTHIVMADSDKGIKQDCTAFCYQGESKQMVTLSLEEKNKFQTFTNDVIREFVPSEFGTTGDDNMKFPIRSVMYEKENASENIALFQERNIGFNYKREISKIFAGNSYKSDLKWNLTDQMMFTCRVQAYCSQILWMLRNHSLFNGGTEKIRVSITYPLAMSPIQLRVIKDAWRRAWGDYIDNQTSFEDSGNQFTLESVAPYKYSAVNNESMNRTDAYVNVDIGGGSTDILFYKERPNKTNKSYAYSVFFAANDIWGNGLDPLNESEKENGYVKILRKKITSDQKVKLDDYEKMASSSADVVNYLFSGECCKQMGWDSNHFADIIKQSEVGGVLVVHFAALMYYLAHVIKIDKLDTPKVINFTGMGSKYINIISPAKNQIEDIIKYIFKYVGLNDADDVKVSLERERNPKEVTAIGALYMLDNRTTQISLPASKNVYCIKGEDEMDDAPTYKYAIEEECQQKTLEQTMDFLNLLGDGQFRNIIVNSGINFSLETLRDCGLTKESLLSSYITMTDAFEDYSEQDKKQKLKDAPFFWTLKDTLFKVANKIGS